MLGKTLIKIERQSVCVRAYSVDTQYKQLINMNHSKKDSTSLWALKVPG